jgi:hypothetical protein
MVVVSVEAIVSRKFNRYHKILFEESRPKTEFGTSRIDLHICNKHSTSVFSIGLLRAVYIYIYTQ